MVFQMVQYPQYNTITYNASNIGNTHQFIRIGIYTQFNIECEIFCHIACGIKIIAYLCNVVQRQCSLNYLLRITALAHLLIVLLADIKRSNISNNASIKALRNS